MNGLIFFFSSCGNKKKFEPFTFSFSHTLEFFKMEGHQQNHPQYGTPHFSSDIFGFNPTPSPYQNHRLQFTDHEMAFLPRGVQGLTVAGTNSNTFVARTSGGGGGGDGGFSGFTDGGGTGRWPRQETLMLLEVRSRLDNKFKEANQKGPLWDEVSRIMSEEHGYTRSGKKCREKFENLYKYYKKTKEGKAGRRQDGKNYRFFRQLEAIYGESKDSVSCYKKTQFIMTNPLHSFHTPNIHNNIAPHQQKTLPNTQSLSLSNNFNSSELDRTSSSEGNEFDRGNTMNWKANIKEFIGVHMEMLIEKQDVWLEKLMKTMEDKDHQRMVKEEERRKFQTARINHERSLWAKKWERMEARDVAVINALQHLTGKALIRPRSSSHEERINEKRSEENMMMYNNQERGVNKSCSKDDQNMKEQSHHEGSSTSNSKNENSSCGIAMAASTNCYPLLMGDGDQNLWEGYGLKLRK